MAKQEIGYRANIGGPSLILIFIVMCLVTFGMLSLSAAKSEHNLAARNASAVTEYYRADGEGEAFYQMVLEKVEAVKAKGREQKEYEELLAQELGNYYRPEEGTVITQIPMTRSQALTIELIPEFEEKGDVRVSKWKVIQTEDYEIDNSMPVWTGGESKKQETGK
jgi:hypothetical protein